jgi:hypothetical protein
MNNDYSQSKEFHDLVYEILLGNDFDIKPSGLREFDFLITLDNEERCAVEVKYYRTARAQISLIDAAVVRLIQNALDAEKVMLIVSCVIPVGINAKLEDSYGVRIIDRTDLINMASKVPELTDKLLVLLNIDTNDDSIKNRGDVEVTGGFQNKKISHLKKSNMGELLCNELELLKPGKEEWSKYEEKCDSIIKYLFADNLYGWHRQLRTDDGLNRYDYICRINPATAFWRFLVEELNSRYIVFEFKNYNDEITQGQVLTTEKYLLEKALRRVAIIISRKGSSNNADMMMQGAMREHGKLILTIDDKKICEMLNMRDRGEDPSDLLFEMVDRFLMTLPR